MGIVVVRGHDLSKVSCKYANNLRVVSARPG